MAYVSVEEIRKHLNIDFSDDDDYLESLIEVGELSVEAYIGQELDKLLVADKGAAEGSGLMVLNPMLRHAVKIMVGNLYGNRESVSYGVPVEVPFTYQYLIKPFKIYK